MNPFLGAPDPRSGKYLNQAPCMTNAHRLWFVFFAEEEIDVAIQNALRTCEKQGIVGKHITPFVLSEVGRVTNGVSMETSKRELEIWKMNYIWFTRVIFVRLFFVFFFVHIHHLDISLLKNNSTVGSLIAREYYSKRSTRSKSIFEIKRNRKTANGSPVRNERNISQNTRNCINFLFSIFFILGGNRRL